MSWKELRKSLLFNPASKGVYTKLENLFALQFTISYALYFAKFVGNEYEEMRLSQVYLLKYTINNDVAFEGIAKREA